MEQLFTRIAVKIESNVWIKRRDGTLDVPRISASIEHVANLYKTEVVFCLILMDMLNTTKMNPETEKFHILSMAKGSKASFNALYMYYHPIVYRFVLALLKNETEAQDLSQEIFYKLWTHKEQLAVLECLKPYLYRMVRNAVYEVYRHSQLDLEFQQTFKPETETAALPEYELYAKEIEELIDIALSQMSQQRQLIFKLSRKDGFSNQEIADKLGISKRTVENSLSLTLSELRNVIQIALLFFVC